MNDTSDRMREGWNEKNALRLCPTPARALHGASNTHDDRIFHHHHHHLTRKLDKDSHAIGREKDARSSRFIRQQHAIPSMAEEARALWTEVRSDDECRRYICRGKQKRITREKQHVHSLKSSFSSCLSDVRWLSHMPWTSFIGARRRPWSRIRFRGLIDWDSMRGRLRKVAFGFRRKRLSLTFATRPIIGRWLRFNDGCTRLLVAIMSAQWT